MKWKIKREKNEMINKQMSQTGRIWKENPLGRLQRFLDFASVYTAAIVSAEMI